MKTIDKEELKEKALEKAKTAAGKGKGFMGEFKDFILKGNVVDMAIGVVIGTAFSGLVTAFTTDFINPLINGLGGAEVGGTIKIYGGQELLWGNFVTSVINFLIMAFVLFLMLKAVHKVMAIGHKKEETKPAEPPKPTKEQELLEEILDELKKQNNKK